MKRLSAVTGEYVNKDNQQKAEWTNVGILNVDKNGKEYVLLDPLYSAAGVLAKQNALAVKRGEQVRDMVMCSVFEENSNQQGQNNQGQQQQQQNQGGFNNQQQQQNQGGFNNQQQQQQQTGGFQQQQNSHNFNNQQ